jgi:flagellar biosynthetic protein FliP
MRTLQSLLLGIFALCAVVMFCTSAQAQARPLPQAPVDATSIALPEQAASVLAKDQVQTAQVVRIALILTLMTLVPAILISMTSFVRIIVVLSMIRHAFGMPETPPNQVLISLALFLTAFSMMPTLQTVNTQALQPFLDGKLTVEQAITSGTGPARDFMLRQVHDRDIQTMYDISRKPLPDRAQDVDLMQLVPAFMLNELRVAFRIGFVVLLPFLLIDLVVSSILLALGMLMVPPSTLSLPLKVLMFVLIDGWSLVLQGVLGSFH